MKNKLTYLLAGHMAGGLFAILLLAGTVAAMNVRGIMAYAADDQVDVLTVEADYRVESHTNISEYREKDNLTAPVFIGEGGAAKWLFAGWYMDKDCTESLPGSSVAPVANGTYYAKYVKKEVLSVRCQLKKDTTSDSENTEIRFVSSVDSLKYQRIGLELVTPSGSEKKMQSQKVGTKIYARKDSGLEDYTYSPKAVDVESEYFFSATETINKADFDKGYMVRPYWITKDGTCVYGVSKYVTVNEGINKDKIHIPVQMDAKPEEGAVFTADDVSATCVKYDEKGGYAHLEVSGVPAASATKYTIKDDSGKAVGSYIYRNMSTAYDGTNPDTSWYDVYDAEGESKFVIATSADLYGFATVVNEGQNFKGKTVYVVSDIDANDKAGSYVWTRIGTETKPFSGTFDGCMHSIKNIKITSGTTTTGRGYGFFGQVNQGAVLKSFKLLGGKYTFGQQQAGSVVGILQDATLDTIYSNAYVEGSYDYLGGLIGNKNAAGKAVVTNCWFDGTVNQKSGNVTRKVGGLLGRCNYNVELNNCLNTGKIQYSNLGTGALGGLIGAAENTGAADMITIKNCMNTGIITPKTGATANFGQIVGKIADKNKITIENSFAISDTTLVDGVDTYEGVTTATEENLTGMEAITSVPELFKNQNSEEGYRWVVVTGSTPVLKSFASEAGNATMGVDTSWYDAEKTEYVLKDAADLYGFALLSEETNFEGKTVKLVSDIKVNEGNAAEWTNIAPDYEWIGISNNSDFAGIFDGQGHTIRGLYMNTATQYRGMFGGTVASAEVKNFSLANSYFKSKTSRIGSIAGRGLGMFDTIYSDAIVEGTGTSVGGLLGQGRAGIVRMNNCWFAGSVTNNYEGAGKNNNGTGGLIGNLLGTAQGVVTNCLNTGTITASKYTGAPRVGGLIGAVEETSTKISHCVNAGKVDSNKVAGYGAFAGRIQGTKMFNNCFAITEMCDALGYSGELTNIDRTTSKLVAQADVAGTNAVTNMPALFQYEEDGVRKNYWSVTADGAPVLTSFEAMAGTSAMGIDFSWYDASKNTYVLKDAADLYGLALLSEKETFQDKTIELGADITVNEGLASTWASDAPAYQWVKIGPKTDCRFSGTFNGNGHTISGLYLKSEAAYSGLFGLTNTAVIKNFKLVNSYFESSKQAVGSISGHTQGSVFDAIYSDAIVVGGQQYVGGLIGQAGGNDLAHTIKVDNCWFDGSVTNTAIDKQSTGGLIGAVTAPKIVLADCLNTGIVSAESYIKRDTVKDENGVETEVESVTPRVGGLIGGLGKFSDGGNCTISRSLNTGKVVYNTQATTGYGSVIGRVTGLSETEVSENEFVVISDTYATTKSCSNTVTGKDNLTNVAVTTVEETEIIGDDAIVKMPGLFTENGKWTAIEKGMPVLISFSGYAKDAGELSPLHRWLRCTSSPAVTLSTPVTLESGTMDAKAVLRQGGYTDGHYFYQAYITEKNESDESQNKVRILKQDLEGVKAPIFSAELPLGHANDITYNEHINQLIVCHAKGNKITFMNSETLEIINTKALGYKINRIAYNAARDCYVVGYAVNQGELGKFGIMDRNFKPISDKFILDKTKDLVGQGASCDDDYIYLLFSEGTADKRNAIAVYNWSGEFINLICLDIRSEANIIEPENISVVGNTIYVSVAECWGTSKNPAKKEANVYSFTID